MRKFGLSKKNENVVPKKSCDRFIFPKVLFAYKEHSFQNIMRQVKLYYVSLKKNTMVDVIYLKKSGLYTRFKKKYHKIDLPISFYLHHSIKIEKGFTIQHLMEILKEYEKDVDLIFQAYTRGFKLEPFYNEMNEP